ncbi:MAG: DUF748 domain-containing protein, partial [Bacteroidales bacterium]|nr:DUF748 domain-containing protein [Bacteroidales bacterium]
KEKKKTKMLVRTLTISNGHFIFDDNALADGFSFQIININIKAKNITQNGAENALLTADLPHGGTATLRFQGKMKDYKERSLVALNVSKLQLRDLSPYGVTYLAYPFTDGILTFNSKNTIEAGYIDGNNHFDVINPEIGERRNDIDSAKHLPLKAILYMLKDKNGRVKLDVPVSGKLDDPKFNYWKSIWKTLGNLLIKMASTPFNNISNALGINANELQFIPLDPMAKDFTNEQYKKLSDLARIARYDSSMVIILAQQINADAEDEMLAMAEQRNERARIYMMQLGVKPGQIMILTQPDLTNVNKIGYKVDSELRSPDNEE